MSKTWRCFHCDEVFRTRKEAWLHFGDDNCITDPPACVDPLRTDEKERFKELREAREWAVERDQSATRLEEELDQLKYEHSEFKKITGCNSVHELRMWMDSQQGRVVTANALIDGFRERAPELAAEIIG